MKKKRVRMYGANRSPPCPMFAMATSLRTNSTSASIAAPKPLGPFPSRWRRSICRPPHHIVTNTRNAASAMNTTCFVGDTSDRKSTRLNSSHVEISYAVFCLKKKKNIRTLVHLNLEENKQHNDA